MRHRVDVTLEAGGRGCTFLSLLVNCKKESRVDSKDALFGVLALARKVQQLSDSSTYT